MGTFLPLFGLARLAGTVFSQSIQTNYFVSWEQARSHRYTSLSIPPNSSNPSWPPPPGTDKHLLPSKGTDGTSSFRIVPYASLANSRPALGMVDTGPSGPGNRSLVRFFSGHHACPPFAIPANSLALDGEDAMRGSAIFLRAVAIHGISSIPHPVPEPSCRQIRSRFFPCCALHARQRSVCGQSPGRNSR